jgi:hypothetical protein
MGKANSLSTRRSLAYVALESLHGVAVSCYAILLAPFFFGMPNAKYMALKPLDLSGDAGVACVIVCIKEV